MTLEDNYRFVRQPDVKLELDSGCLAGSYLLSTTGEWIACHSVAVLSDAGVIEPDRITEVDVFHAYQEQGGTWVSIVASNQELAKLFIDTVTELITPEPEAVSYVVSELPAEQLHIGDKVFISAWGEKGVVVIVDSDEPRYGVQVGGAESGWPAVTYFFDRDELEQL